MRLLLALVILAGALPSSLGRQFRKEEWIEQVSWSPRAYVFHRFLRPEECRALLSRADAALLAQRGADAARAAAPASSHLASNSRHLPHVLASLMQAPDAAPVHVTLSAGLQGSAETALRERLARWTAHPTWLLGDLHVVATPPGRAPPAHDALLNAQAAPRRNGTGPHDAAPTRRLPLQGTVVLFLSRPEGTGGEVVLPRAEALQGAELDALADAAALRQVRQGLGREGSRAERQQRWEEGVEQLDAEREARSDGFLRREVERFAARSAGRTSRLARPSCEAPDAPGLALAPRAGDALLLWDVLPDQATPDPSALRRHCPSAGGAHVLAALSIFAQAPRREEEPPVRAELLLPFTGSISDP